MFGAVSKMNCIKGQIQTSFARSRPNICCLQSRFGAKWAARRPIKPFKSCRAIDLAPSAQDTSGHFVDLQLGQKAARLPSSAVGHSSSSPPPPPSVNNIKAHISEASHHDSYHLFFFLFFFWWRPKTLQAPVSRDGSISAVKTELAVIVGPSSLTHCSSSHSASSTFLPAADGLPLPCLALPRCSFIYAQTRYAQKWFSMQAAGRSARVYLGDLNPAGTGERWGSHSRSWGPTAEEIARPCRRRPCR